MTIQTYQNQLFPPGVRVRTFHPNFVSLTGELSQEWHIVARRQTDGPILSYSTDLTDRIKPQLDFSGAFTMKKPVLDFGAFVAPAPPLPRGEPTHIAFVDELAYFKPPSPTILQGANATVPPAIDFGMLADMARISEVPAPPRAKHKTDWFPYDVYRPMRDGVYPDVGLKSGVVTSAYYCTSKATFLTNKDEPITNVVRWRGWDLPS